MFIPSRIIFEKKSLDYEIGQNILDFFKDKDVEIIKMTNAKLRENIPGETIYDYYREGKNTLVVGIKKGKTFQTCKPSADYQLPLVSGCMGQCQYCYLNTNLSEKPYQKVHVNVDYILEQAQNYIDENPDKITVFEGSATSDPIPVEPYTHLLQKTIEFFANKDNASFRFVTKFNDVDTLLNVKHNKKTEIRYTLNTQYVIDNFENRTAAVKLRIDAALKVLEAGYPLGFIIAPVFIYDGWKEDYRNLLLSLKDKLFSSLKEPVTFEVISHRYTPKAKSVINDIFPDNTLPMNDEIRKYKFGQFGYGKYVYTKEELADMKSFFKEQIPEIFKDMQTIKYII